MERTTQRLSSGYAFRLYPEGNAPAAVFAPDYDASDWETVRVPHDWAAAGVFEEQNDCSLSVVTQDGIECPIAHSGRTGALPIVGEGVYRLKFDVPAEAAGRRLFLEFDGIMWESDIYVNGVHACFNHFGYKSFCTEITDLVRCGAENLLAVSARVYEDCSRWYPGAGIFRNVYLVTKSPVHIPWQGAWLRQLELSGGCADFLLTLDWEGPENVSCRAEILDPDGVPVTEAAASVSLGELSALIRIPDAKLWDIGSPHLYTARITLLDGTGAACDNVSLRFGARSAKFTPDEGFLLNGKKRKLNGVCMHHDLGSLGAAVSVPALRRQLRILRDMGVNAIRTSHNPPAPELLELCDELGFLVMDEFFDEWYLPKVKNGYAKYFRTHAVQDAVDILRRDRNHPCIILWSIGNEICEQSDPEGWRAAKLLSDTVHRTDPTRPVTAGLNEDWNGFENRLTDFLDVVGLNYKPHYYRQAHEKYPEMVLLGSETASCVSTRGVFHLPAEIELPVPVREDLTVSDYGLSSPSWAYYPEREFSGQDDCPYVAGEFIWTGMDYLGEPTPYYDRWPARSSYFGAVDLAGLPKSRFYGYKARWSGEPVLHIIPHWNWEGMEGRTVPVHVYTSYPEAELFINGVSFGRRSFLSRGDAPMEQVRRYRLIWENAVYAPGEVKAVAYDAEGNPAAEAVVKTAGAPSRLILTPEREVFSADGEDLVYFTAAVADEAGTVCPLASNRLTFAVTGAGELLTTDAGDPRETESFARPDKKALAGLCVACVRSRKDIPGTVTVSVTAEGLSGAEASVSAV